MPARRKVNRDGIRAKGKPRPTTTVDMIECRRPRCAYHKSAHWIYYTDEERKRWNAKCSRWAMKHPEAFEDDDDDDTDLDELAGGADEFREGA